MFEELTVTVSRAQMELCPPLCTRQGEPGPIFPVLKNFPCAGPSARPVLPAAKTRDSGSQWDLFSAKNPIASEAFKSEAMSHSGL